MTDYIHSYILNSYSNNIIYSLGVTIIEKSLQNDKTKKGRTRSPSYPAIDLESAIVLARKLYAEIGQTNENIEVILDIWGHNPKSGHALVKIASLIRYGLIKDEGSKDKRTAKLTELALTIVPDEEKSSDTYQNALKEAALNPSIHKELWDKYSGSLPSDNTLKIMLVKEMKFSERGVNEFIKQFRKTIEFTKLNTDGNITTDEDDKDSDINGETEDSSSEEQIMDEKNKQTSLINPEREKSKDFIVIDSIIGSLKVRYPMNKEKLEVVTKFLKAEEAEHNLKSDNAKKPDNTVEFDNTKNND